MKHEIECDECGNTIGYSDSKIPDSYTIICSDCKEEKEADKDE